MTDYRHFPLLARLLVLLLVLLGGAAELVAKEEFACEISVGYDGKLPEGGSLVPIIVTVENNRQSTTGTIEIMRQSGTGEVRQVEAIELPAPSKRRFVVLTRVYDDQGLWIRVKSDDNIFPPTVKEIPSTAQGSLPLVLFVRAAEEVYRDKSNGFLQAASNPKWPFSKSYQVIRVREHALFEDPLAYDGLHAVVLSPECFSTLNGPERQALKAWVLTGGRLMLYGPQRAGRDVATTTAEFGITPEMLAEVGVHSLGAGMVAIDGLVESEPPFWRNPAWREPTLAFFPKVYQDNLDSVFGGFGLGGAEPGIFSKVTEMKGSYGMRGFVWLTLIIVAYLLVIGPLDYFLVKRLGKPYLTWVFFLASIVGFSVLSYWYSSLVHSGMSQGVQINIVDGAVGQPIGRGNSLFWLYASRNDRYRIDTETAGVAFAAREMKSGVGMSAGVLIQHPGEPTIDAKIPIFSSKTFDAAWIAQRDLAFQVTEREGRLQVTVPEGLEVTAMELATGTGNVALTHQEGGRTWSQGSVNPTSWKVLFNSYLPDEMSRYDSAFTSSRGPDELPTEETVRDYVNWISFGYLPPNKELAIEEDEDPTDTPDRERPDEAQVQRDLNDLESRSYRDAQSSEVVSLTRLMQGIDGREMSLNVRPRLEHGGRILMVYLAPESTLLPLTMSTEPQAMLRMDILRLQLPPAAPATPTPTPADATPQTPDSL